MNGIPGQVYPGTTRRSTEPDAKIWVLHLLLLVALTFAVMVWGVTLVAGARGHDLEQFITVACFFGVACAFFVVLRVSVSFHTFFELPVFMTVLAFLEFGVAPIISFLNPAALSRNFHGDNSFFLPALEIVIVGMVAFWLGAGTGRLGKQPPGIVNPVSLPSQPARQLTVILATCLYLCGFMAKIYLLRSGMFSYLSSATVVDSRLAEMQVWGVVCFFGLYSLIVFAVEAYSHPEDKVRAALFWAVLASESVWGLISGMKSQFLFNLIAVALVSSLIKRKLQVGMIATAILAFIVIYPLISRYRALVRTKASDATTSFSAATAAMQGAATASADQERTAADWAATGLTSAMTRVDMTQNVALLLAYQDRAYLLEGDERLWMIPVYPFIPRFVWPEKPVENSGQRFTRLLGGAENLSTSCTAPGDLYVLHGGILGVLLGMFLLGLGAQWLTNPVARNPSKRNIFVYACMFFAYACWETDFFAFSTNVIRSFVLVQVLALAIYGPARGPSRLKMLVGRALHRR